MPTARPPLNVSPPEDPDRCEVACVHPQAVARARAAQPDEGTLARAAALLKAVSDPTRLRLLTALGTGELCVCDLAAVAGTSESAVSHQLRLLRGQQLVAPRKEGRVVYYRLADDHVAGVLGNVLEHVGHTAP
ncbi:ArsR/SmtB family transcription factor [Deinococcus budaensis]|uniref:DNA-binding transcriptional ArsR family regulator n=1 Tax=Deinococcus budaensis TaxID=1665626 RepID=A0A7W8LRB3_9DEIO|nr:metalloregulator ArsR/SmtB family transcription factor [Deinococcus budaensis]MBB5235701.1 DNA-binding transcriptional ArsR family regulator [Deinococcus budaensis]